MTFTNATSAITSLRTIINNTSAWTYGESVIHYPDTTSAERSATVYAILADEDGDSATIMLYAREDTLSIGQLRELAENIADQIRSDRRADLSGLLIPDRPDVGQVGAPSEHQRAGDSSGAATSYNCVDIFITYPVL